MIPQPPFPATVLIADDLPENREILAALLENEGYRVVLAEDGQEASDLMATGPIDIALLDVVMPRRTGFDVCRQIKSRPETRLLPVVLVTGLNSTKDRVQGIECGADDFLNKPIKKEELIARVKSLLRIKQVTDELEHAETVLFSLALGIEAKDPYTKGHCDRLSTYSVALGRRLGLGEDKLVALRRGGVIHDLGKIGVPDHILLKPGPLSAEEWVVMKKHPEIGERICQPLRSFGLVLPIIRHHHEKLDGTGYPDGLKNGAIPLLARILTTADVYDALTTDRSYRLALPPERAFEIIEGEVKCGWWDGDLVAQMRALIREGTVHSLLEASRDSAHPVGDTARDRISKRLAGGDILAKSASK
jgi:putative two-component system response regulator